MTIKKFKSEVGIVADKIREVVEKQAQAAKNSADRVTAFKKSNQKAHLKVQAIRIQSVAHATEDAQEKTKSIKKYIKKEYHCKVDDMKDLKSIEEIKKAVLKLSK